MAKRKAEDEEAYRRRLRYEINDQNEQDPRRSAMYSLPFLRALAAFAPDGRFVVQRPAPYSIDNPTFITITPEISRHEWVHLLVCLRVEDCWLWFGQCQIQGRPRVHHTKDDIQKVPGWRIAQFAYENGYFTRVPDPRPSFVDFYFDELATLLTELRRVLEQVSPLPLALFQTICDFF
jgi:hypothetical protein